jgi:FKBP-type peptidyl-prolyl cis-trans isomerase FkpA/FKBP-type peptidyl-prolyl cis-trans isomerase FklB
MKLIAAFVTVALLAVVPLWAEAPATGPKLDTEEQKTLYALGIWLSGRVAPLNISAADMEFVQAGFVDGVLGHEKKVDLAVYGPKIDEMAKSRAGAVAANEKKAGQAYAEKAAAEKGAVKKPSGLLYFEVKPGTGDSPKATDKVKVHYRGTAIDGIEFDSSIKRGEPAEFPLNGVIACWTEGLQLMKVGGKGKLICPSDIAYGDQGRPGIKPGATLVFEVELLEIVKAEAPKPDAP